MSAGGGAGQLGALLEEAALALAGGNAIAASELLQRAKRLCDQLHSNGIQLSAEDLNRAKAAQKHLNEMAPKLQQALSVAVKSAGDSRRAVTAYREW